MPTMLFVDDPVRGNPLRPTADAIRALDGEEWLSTILIDHLLQTTLKGCVPDLVLIGSSDCYSYFSTYNDIQRRMGHARECVFVLSGILAPVSSLSSSLLSPWWNIGV
ncbi:hypothetical protein IV203_020053 [Nitzschia inconspicua]|uniref:Uncharacterized protein n=1 Tax=Nitzschia inconspicua TaxID=303405 RepID=A0A9K3LZK2_9STRA|nr:hypothetical protein IV203_020053 [Nitzschia inconspicua]